MTFDTLFSLAGSVAVLGWLVLLAAPQRSSGNRLAQIAATTIAVALGLVYAALLGAFWAGSSGGFGSLSDVAALFSHPGLLLAGWVHYLAFDLLIGLWERDEAQRIGLSRWLLAPCLLLTFWFGPIGWLLFMVMRWYRVRLSAVAASSAAS